MPSLKNASYAQKLAQANKEAKAAVIGLVITVVAWIALGFGLSGLDVSIAHTPLWVIGGTVGTWVVAMVISWWMSTKVIADYDLDDEPAAEGEEA